MTKTQGRVRALNDAVSTRTAVSFSPPGVVALVQRAPLSGAAACISVFDHNHTDDRCTRFVADPSR